MSQSEDTHDLVKRVTESALKAVAGRAQVTVSYSPGTTPAVVPTPTEQGPADAETAYLPSPPRNPAPGALARLRGMSDQLASASLTMVSSASSSAVRPSSSSARCSAATSF